MERLTLSNIDIKLENEIKWHTMSQNAIGSRHPQHQLWKDSHKCFVCNELIENIYKNIIYCPIFPQQHIFIRFIRYHDLCREAAKQKFTNWCKDFGCDPVIPDPNYDPDFFLTCLKSGRNNVPYYETGSEPQISYFIWLDEDKTKLGAVCNGEAVSYEDIKDKLNRFI